MKLKTLESEPEQNVLEYVTSEGQSLARWPSPRQL